MRRFIPAALIGAAIVAVPLLAQAPTSAPTSAPRPPMAPPGKADPSIVTGGSYALEGSHTQVVFAYKHMGLTDNMGLLSGGTGTLVLDPKNPGAARLTVEMPVNTIHTTIAKLDEEFQDARFFDAAKFPTAKFVSTAIKVDGTSAEVSGNLTIKGVTRPVVIDASFVAAGVTGGMGTQAKAEQVAFNGTTTIKRSDFGLGLAVPMVGDEVELRIVAAFTKPAA